MARNQMVRHAFNRGIISPLALARVDLKRAALSAEIQSNWMPRAMGSMMLRPGLGYILTAPGASRNIEFIRSLSETHILHFTEGAMRIITNDAFLSRVAVGALIADGNFASPASFAVAWNNNDEVGGVSAWQPGSYMGLTGNGTAAAARSQQVAISNIGVEHSLLIEVERGPVQFRIGTTVGLDDVMNEITLGAGVHNIAFTPTSAVVIVYFRSTYKRIMLVKSCNIVPAGAVALATPYPLAALQNIRANTDSLSVDVLFVGCSGYQQRKIERRHNGRSWSIVIYQPEDGPYRAENTTTQTLTPSVLSGNGTLTSSASFFRSSHVGALFRIASIGQTVTSSMTGTTSTSAITVTGVTTDRLVAITLTGLTATGNTVILQRSFDNAIWTAVSGQTWNADTTTNYTDSLDNQIVYYRLTCSVYAAGTTVATLSIATGSIKGVCRVTGYTSVNSVSMEVLSEFGSTSASENWSEGLWSDYRGWPSSGALYEGRLAWGGYDRITLSVSDAFDSFDPDTAGDSGPINRTIGSGPMDVINWILPMQRLILGAQLAEHSVRSNTFDEPLTPSNFNRKRSSKEGSAAVQAVSLGSKGMYVQRSGSRLMELSIDQETQDYGSSDLTVLNPEILNPYVVRMAIQMKPDIRVHCVLSDGTVAVLVYDSAEKVVCWIKLTTHGLVEDVCVLPAGSGVGEDRVYYEVKRTINGSDIRYLEKFALESECQGGTVNKQADAFVTFSNSPASATVTGLTHLIGEDVICWADGVALNDSNGDIALFTVSASGTISLTHEGLSFPASTGMVGLPYQARFRSAKLGQTIAKQKNIDHIAPILYNTHAQGVLMGPDFTNMDNLPLMYHGAAVDPDTVYAEYDEQDQEFPGIWDTDTRVCLEANAPRCATILAIEIMGQVSE